MARTEARRRMVAVSLAALLALGSSTVGAGDPPSPNVVRLLHSSQQLTSQSQAVRKESADVYNHVRARAEGRRRDRLGTARSENFTILAAADDDFAELVLAAAETHRREIALAWLGHELPAGSENTIIRVEVTDSVDVGLAMLQTQTTSLRNQIWLNTSPKRASGSTLAHEIAHVVLGSRFDGRMPVWAAEGVSCQYDDATRIQRRRQLLCHFARTERWPSTSRLLECDSIAPADEASYTVAASLTEYLLTLADRSTFLTFVVDGKNDGWEIALRRHYQIESVSDLDVNWRRWARTTAVTPQPIAARNGHDGWVPVADAVLSTEY